MAFNFQQMGMIQKAKPMFDKFREEHPKIIPYMNAVYQSVLEKGSVVEISVTSPDGRTLASNLKVTDNDLALLNLMTEMNSHKE